MLHWYIRHRTVTRTTSWIATVSDSFLTYRHVPDQRRPGLTAPAVLLLHDARRSIPLRRRMRSPRVLVLNGGLLIALHVLGEQHDRPAT